MCETNVIFFCLLSGLVTFVIFYLAAFFSMTDEAGGSETGPPHYQEWPITDSDGYFLSHKEGSRWVNYWTRNRKPGFLSTLRFFWLDRDNSGIPWNNEAALSSNIPVLSPNFKEALKEECCGIWLGHSSLYVKVDDTEILTDPIFSLRASLVQFAGPKRFRPSPVQVSDLPDSLDAVIISHNHYDHLDKETCIQLHRRYGNKLKWFVPSGTKDWIISNVLETENNASHIHDMVWWQEEKIKDTKIVLTPSNHWCRRGLFDENKMLWGSWTVIGPKHKFFFGGDTAYHPQVFKQIHKRYGSMDLSAIPIGAYNPRWFMKWVHVNPEESVNIHQDLKSKQSLGIHWGTFRLTYEPYMEPKTRLNDVLKKRNISLTDFKTINLGEFVKS